MDRFKIHLLVALLAFGIGLLSVFTPIIKSHFIAASVKESFRQIEETKITEGTEITYENDCNACPHYKLTIYADGSVVFEGLENVKTKGMVKSSISQEKLLELIKEFEMENYFSLNDQYLNKADGCPEIWDDESSIVNTSIKINGKSKSISHYRGCQDILGRSVYPEQLTHIEYKITEIAGTKQWTE
jgi:hypothetical protein